MTHRIEAQVAYVLHTRAYQENSLLVELFTKENGRISVVAKSVKRSPHRARLLQVFTPILVSCSGRNELLTLKNVEAFSMPPIFKSGHLVNGLYLNELLLRLLLRFEPHLAVFQAYHAALNQLETETLHEPILRVFEKTLLKELGYELPLLRDAESGDAIQAEEWYTFDPERGPVKVLKYHTGYPGLIRGRSFIALANETLNETQALLDAKRIMRHALALHLGSKPLQTRRLFV